MDSENNDKKKVVAILCILIAFGLGLTIGISHVMSEENDSNASNATKEVIVDNVTHNISMYENESNVSDFDASEDPLNESNYSENSSAIYYSDEQVANNSTKFK